MLPDTQEVFSVTKEICLGNYWVRKYVVMQTFCYTSRHCNTWLLQDHLSLMLCSKCVCLCMIRKLHVCLLWSASFDTFRALLTLVYIYILPPLISSSPILMQTGVNVQTPEDSHLGCVYLGDNLDSWFVKRQPTLSRSSAEVEYRAVTNVVFESCW
jgi:hypothetical protein